MDLIDTQEVKSEAGSHDVHDRVHGPDLMKMYAVHRNTVHFCLRFPEAPEDPGRGFLDAFRESALCDEIEDFLQVTTFAITAVP